MLPGLGRFVLFQQGAGQELAELLRRGGRPLQGRISLQSLLEGPGRAAGVILLAPHEAEHHGGPDLPTRHVLKRLGQVGRRGELVRASLNPAQLVQSFGMVRLFIEHGFQHRLGVLAPPLLLEADADQVEVLDLQGIGGNAFVDLPGEFVVPQAGRAASQEQEALRIARLFLQGVPGLGHRLLPVLLLISTLTARQRAEQPGRNPPEPRAGDGQDEQHQAQDQPCSPAASRDDSHRFRSPMIPVSRQASRISHCRAADRALSNRRDVSRRGIRSTPRTGGFAVPPYRGSSNDDSARIKNSNSINLVASWEILLISSDLYFISENHGIFLRERSCPDRYGHQIPPGR